ncbi:MAG: nucleoside triphosphate pyrophosphatase [Pirellulales bacterium]
MSPRGPKLILASGSPQRKRLLADARYTFRIVAPRPQAECGVCSRETPGELVARLARQKAADVADQLRSAGNAASGQIIVACDTVAECRGRILGKPANRDHARGMLKQLSGQLHRVYSGLCLWPLSTNRPRTEVARTTLRMDRLDEAQIEEYLDSGEWQEKAGAFGYQDRPGWLHIVEGSESNVVGLPLELVEKMLADCQSAVGGGP